MKGIRLFIFDLDGTIADTSSGIYECHRLANLKMRGKAPTDEELRGVIGGPLLKTYIERFGFTEQDARQAVRIYREYYADKGTDGAVLYDGMAETLCELKKRGYLTAVATLKAEGLAKSILNRLGVDEYFDVIHGMDENDSLTKCDLIGICCRELKCTASQSILVGDSEHDAKGAAQAGVGFIGCTYGFGFTGAAEIAAFEPSTVINNPNELISFLDNHQNRG
ncbi:MAG: HAD family hydrolase [Oscillospiraceae bacterium]